MADDQNEILKKEKIRIWILSSDFIKIDEKRKIFEKWDEISYKDLLFLKNKLYNDNQENKLKEEKQIYKKKYKEILLIFRNLLWLISNLYSNLWFKKYFIIPVIIISFWFIYSSPAWVKINWYPWEVYKVRKSLSFLKEKDNDFYKLITQNTDIINIDDIEVPTGKWAHAVKIDWKNTMRIFRPNEISMWFLTSTLVHESCHHHQYNYDRFLIESHQKLENECTYLWLYILEEHFPTNFSEIKNIKKEAEDDSWFWWDWWKNSWTLWDTTFWLADLLPEERIKEYKFFWYNYDYDN